MADSDRIADALCAVSDHLEAIGLLGGALAYVSDDSLRKDCPYDFCIAFRLLAEAARSKLELASMGVDSLLDEAKVAAAFRADLNALSRVSRAG